ncbi:MAG: TRAP transporter substrate-binding protein DctP [Ilumatobacteraceae bacterium]
MRAQRITFIAVAMVAAIASIGGCSSSDGNRAGQKSGGDPAPRTLRLGTVEEASAPYAAEVLHFADTVKSKSKGTLLVDVVWAAAGDYTAQTEQQVATMVRDGELDAAIVPTRVWDKLGVTSMQALQAPFLVDSLDLLDTVATGPIASEMLAGLAPVGLAGLALWPESLRHPIGMNRLLVTSDDFAGARLRVPVSDVSEQLARAIGAEPVDPPDWSTALESGELDGFESGFLWADQLPAFGTFTANITFYPKVNSVAMNSEVFGDLSQEQQAMLRDAATDTITFIQGSHDTERVLAAAYCAAGGGVALASDADIAALATKAEPVVAKLEQDAASKAFVEQIQVIKRGLTVDLSSAPAECELVKEQPPATEESAAPTTFAPVVGTAPALATGATEFPAGTYRTEVSGDLIVTMEFADGIWQSFLNGTLDCAGNYAVESGRIVMWHSSELSLACGDAPGIRFLDANWTLDGDQFRFVDINSDPSAVRDFGVVWTKIE